MLSGVIFDVQTACLYDGPGLRTTVYLRGCPLRCAWCHNPEAWLAPDRETPSPRGGPPSFRRVTVDELVAEVIVDAPFFADSGGGVTFSGGEPTVQSEFLLEALAAFRARGIHTAIETCGDFPAELIDALLERCDLFLFDLKSVDPARHAFGTGRDNGRIVANLSELARRVDATRLIPRVPLIPGFNTDPSSLETIAELLAQLGLSGPAHLMPYHAMARDKYRRLGRSDEFVERPAVTHEEIAAAEGIFREMSFEPLVCG